MIRRIMAALGLLAFAITLLGGLLAGNTFESILSRGLWAMVLFCALGWVVGAAAQYVVREYQTAQSREVLGPPQPDAHASSAPSASDNSTSSAS